MNQTPIKDATLRQSFFLPATNATTMSDVVDLQVGEDGTIRNGVELHVEAPELATGELADAATITYTLEGSTTSTFDTVSASHVVGVQTGAGGVGDAGGSFPFAIPQTGQRYWRAKATQSADVDNSAIVAAVVPVLPM